MGALPESAPRAARLNPRLTAGDDLLVRRFSSVVGLSDVETTLLRLLEKRTRRVLRQGSRVLTQGERMQGAGFIQSGWAAEVRELRQNRKQIVSLLLPGDFVGLSRRADEVSAVHVETLTHVSIVDAREMARVWHDPERVPRLVRGLELMATESEWFRIAAAVRLGRQTARERIANFFLELEYRLASRGMSTNGVFAMPLKQDTLGHVTGLSVVHVNRTLQALRRDGLIDLAGGRLEILDRPALQAEAEFLAPQLAPVAPMQGPS